MYNKKTLTFTFHHYWGAFCQGPFVLDLSTLTIGYTRRRKTKETSQYNTPSFGFHLTCVRWSVSLFLMFHFFIYVTASDKKGPDAVLPIFHCDVVKFATSHNKNEHLLTGQMHINEPIK